MQTLKKSLKSVLSLTVLLAMLAGSELVSAETVDGHAPDAHQHEPQSFEWPGIYNGFMPCPDCTGIKTTLALNKNNSYLLITQYVGRSDREFVEKGKYSWNPQTKMIDLTPKNGTTNQHYLVSDNTLIQLDSNGNRITGKQAERYVMRRTDITDNQPSHSGHGGH